MKRPLKDILSEVLGTVDIVGDKMAMSILLKEIYKYHGKDTMRLFLSLQDLERNENKEKIREYYSAAESGMHSFTGAARRVVEDKSTRNLKGYLRLKISEVAELIDMAKTLYPDGTAKYASDNGRWFFVST